MVDRKDFGSWLEGPRARTSGAEPGGWRGRGLGMPPSGPGAIATFGVRLGAVVVDWAVALLISRGLFGVPLPFTDPPPAGGQTFVTLGVFAAMNLLLVGTIGSTIGHRAFGLRVRALDGGRVRPLQTLARTALLCLFLPAVIWDQDGRGLHDKVPNTVIVRTR